MDIELKREVDLAFRISSRFFGGSDITLCPIVGKGSVNKVYVAKTAHDRAVVRMSDRNDAFDEYQKEAWCIERAAELGVRSPRYLRSACLRPILT